MNIPDVGNSPETTQVEAAHMLIDTPNVNTSGETRPVRETQPVQRRDEYVRTMQGNIKKRPDEYIPTRIIALRSNLYDVSDISRNRNNIINSREVGSSLPTGEKVDEKLFDIILSGGLKSLQVYRKKRIAYEEA
ncbi:hypothetical protein ACFL5B_01325 [Candidatus Latescibacterota bacterium]